MCTTKLESGVNKAITDLRTHFTWSVKVHCRYPKWLLMGPAAVAHWHVNVCEEVNETSLENAKGGNTEVQGSATHVQSICHLKSQCWDLNGGLNYSARAGNEPSVLLPWTRSDLQSLYILKICSHNVCVWPQPLRSCCKTSTKKRKENNNIIRKWFFCQ